MTASATENSPPKVTRIRPPGRFETVHPREIWESRDLLYFLAWRDLKIRYKQALLGVAWAVLQPMAMMVIFTLFLGRLVGVPSEGLPYAVFALAGLIPWTFFANAVNGASESIVTNAMLISRVFFPRILLPFGSQLSWIVDLGIGTILLLVVAALFGVLPAPTAPLFFLFLLLALVTAGGVGVWLAALNVAYRDVKYAVPFAIQLWLFATPVVYPASLVPSQYQWIYGLNPMAGVVQGFRWALFGSTPPAPSLVLVSSVVAVVLLITGVVYFSRTERYFADIV